MLDFVFILLIFLEIILSAICVYQLIQLEKKVLVYNEKLTILSEKIIETNKSIRKIIKKINKVVSIFSNKKFIVAKDILKFTLNTIQIIILIRSLNISKGFIKSINFKNIKKLFYAEIIRKILFKIIDIYKDVNLSHKKEEE